MPISQNTALFSLLGTTYGGDGKSTFALPDLQGSAPMQPDQGPGLSLHDLGERAGSESVTLLQTEIPVHNHTVMAAGAATPAADDNPSPSVVLAPGTRGATPYAPVTTDPPAIMSPQALSVAGASYPHNNMQPYLTLNFCIALQGVFPPRT